MKDPTAWQNRLSPTSDNLTSSQYGKEEWLKKVTKSTLEIECLEVQTLEVLV